MMQCRVKGEVNWFRWDIPKVTVQSSVTNFFPIVYSLRKIVTSQKMLDLAIKSIAKARLFDYTFAMFLIAKKSK